MTRTSGGRFKSQFWFLGSAVVSGVSSYVAMFLVSHQFDIYDFSNFVAGWTLINGVVLALFSPIESLAPGKFSRESSGNAIQYLYSQSIKAAFYGLLMVIPLSILFRIADVHYFFIFSLGILTYGLWNATKAVAFGKHKVKTLFLLILFSSFALVITLFLLRALEVTDTNIFLYSLPISWLTSFIIFYFFIRKNLVPEEIKKAKFGFHIAQFKSIFRVDLFYGSVLLGYLASMIPGMFGLVLAGKLISDDVQLSSYLGTVLITRAGLLIVNTATPAISLEHTFSGTNAKRNIALLFLHAGIFIAASIPAVFLLYTFGNSLASVLLDQDIQLRLGEIVIIVIGECLLAATVATRTTLISLGIPKGHFLPWIFATGVAIVIAVLFKGVLGLAFGAISAGLMVLLSQFHYLAKELKWNPFFGGKA